MNDRFSNVKLGLSVLGAMTVAANVLKKRKKMLENENCLSCVSFSTDCPK